MTSHHSAKNDLGTVFTILPKGRCCLQVFDSNMIRKIEHCEDQSQAKDLCYSTRRDCSGNSWNLFHQSLIHAAPYLTGISIHEKSFLPFGKLDRFVEFNDLFRPVDILAAVRHRTLPLNEAPEKSVAKAIELVCLLKLD